MISQKYGTKKEPNTYLGGSKRIYFIFCSDYLSTFLDKYGITPFNEVISPDYRGLFLDLILTSFLKNSYISLPDHTLHSLKSSNTQSVINYKRHIRAYVDKYKMIEQATAIHKKIVKKYFSNDYNNINKPDVLLTTGMIKAERMIKKYYPHIP